MGNLDGPANLLWAGNLGGDLFGDILANFLGDLGTNRPLGPTIFFFRKTRMAFINHNGFAFVYNLGFNLVFHDSDHFGDILTNILTLFLRHHDRNLTGFGDTDFLTFLLVPKRYKIKVIKGQFNRVVSIIVDFCSEAIF